MFSTVIDGYIGEVAVPETTTNETHDINLGEIKIQGLEATFTARFDQFNVFLSHTRSNLTPANYKAHEYLRALEKLAIRGLTKSDMMGC